MRDDVVGQVDRIRALTHRVLRAPIGAGDTVMALMFLLRQARATDWPDAACTALVTEILGMIDDTTTRDDIKVGNPWMRTQRLLRRQGYSACPVCLTPIATELDLVVLEDLIREGAA